MIKKIYGYSKEPIEKREFTPLKLINREKKLAPIISSEKKKFKENLEVMNLKIYISLIDDLSEKMIL